MNALQIALTFTLHEEGGWVDNPTDHGGPTNHGITQSTYDQYRKSKDQPLLTVRFIAAQELEDIYRGMFWWPAHCNDMPLQLAVCHFDWAVNHGPPGAIKTLQQALEVEIDGVFGPHTRKAMLDAVDGTLEELLDTYCALRRDFYIEDAEKDPSQQQFEKDWLGRDERVRNYVETLGG
ncbi:MAG: secretion activating protein [Chloroflexi bacterium]|nr:secretion activating protein [Chloroflexota bacterium]